MKSHSIKVILFFSGIFFLAKEAECLKKRWLDESCYLPGLDPKGVPYKPTEFRCGRSMEFGPDWNNPHVPDDMGQNWYNRRESELVKIKSCNLSSPGQVRWITFLSF